MNCNLLSRYTLCDGKTQSGLLDEFFVHNISAAQNDLTELNASMQSKLTDVNCDEVSLIRVSKALSNFIQKQKQTYHKLEYQIVEFTSPSTNDAFNQSLLALNISTNSKVSNNYVFF
jgi:hypothetical protein